MYQGYSQFGFNPQPEPPRYTWRSGVSTEPFRARKHYMPPGIMPIARSGGYAGFGLMVPTPLPGQPSYAPNMQATGFNYCGSQYGFQQMLQDLGFYKGAIDGKAGTATITAAKNFAAQYGAPWGGSLSNQFCQRLMDVWQAQMQGPPIAQGPVQMPSTQVPPPPTGRPTGTPPNGAGPPQPGTTTTQPPLSEPGFFDKAKAWWDGQSTGAKVAIGVGGAAVVGLAIWALVGKKKTTESATPNRRRRRGRRRYRQNPLRGGSSRKTIGRNIAKLRREGRSASQASAIAYRSARDSFHQRHPRKKLPAHLKRGTGSK